ncbi:MAG: DUF4479 domain-containing protein, partial [Ligilactobacillus ruminis]|nr:DUF4479 domain-containing protein [Ligilactobacillus ruminis]
MLIASYNKEQLGDVLLTVVAPDAATQSCEKKGDVVRIFDAESGKTTGYNFFNVSKIISGLETKKGQIFLDNFQVDALNKALKENGFSSELVVDEKPKFVVGYVEKLEEHPDSDHLHVTSIKVDDDHLKIVCGAPNIEQGQNVVIAKVGAMMPDGTLIFPGKLRGIDSFGMVCS